MLALLAIPAVRQFERRHSLLLPALLLAVGLLVRYEALEVKDDGPPPLSDHGDSAWPSGLAQGRSAGRRSLTARIRDLLLVFFSASS